MPSDDRKVPELRAPKQNAALARAAKALGSVEGAIDKYAELPLDIFLPVSSEFLEKLSYGDPFFRQAPAGTGSRIPMTADREYLMEALFGAGTVAPMAQGAARAGRALGQRMQPQADELSSVLDAVEAQRFSRGGKVVDLLAEVLKGKSKAKPTKDAPDPSRRAALGLPKDLTPKPGEMVVKEEVKKAPKTGETSVSLTEAMNVPMSRRDVLRAGAGQAISAMAPRGALGALVKAAGSPTGVIEQAITQPALSPAKAAMAAPLSVQAMIAKAIKEAQEAGVELSGDDLMERVIAQKPRMRPRTEEGEDNLRIRILDMADPESFDIAGVYRESPGPLGLMMDMMDIKRSQDLRQVLRQVREMNPEHYEKLKKVSRDIDDFLGDAYGDELRDLAQEHGDDFGDLLD